IAHRWERRGRMNGIEVDSAEKLKRDLEEIDRIFAGKPDPAKQSATHADLDRMRTQLLETIEEVATEAALATRDFVVTYFEDRLEQLAGHCEAVIAEELADLEKRLVARIDEVATEIEGTVAIRTAAGLSDLAQEKIDDTVGTRLDAFRSEYKAEVGGVRKNLLD